MWKGFFFYPSYKLFSHWYNFSHFAKKFHLKDAVKTSINAIVLFGIYLVYRYACIETITNDEINNDLDLLKQSIFKNLIVAFNVKLKK